MGLPHNVSYRANRADMYEDPPTYTQILTEVAAKPLTKMDRGLIALGLLTAGRISELINCRAHNIKLYDINGVEISSGGLTQESHSGCLYKGLQPKDISRIEVTLQNKKSKTKKIKKVPAINVGEFETPIKWLLERLQELPDPLYEDMIYGKSRTQAWFMIKEINPSWYTHIMRHFSTSNDVRHGINPAVIQKKNGWADLKMLSRYTHLQTADMVAEMERQFGKKPIPVIQPVKVPMIKEIPAKPAYVAPSLRPFVSQAARRQLYDRAGHRIIQKTQKELDNELLQVV